MQKLLLLFTYHSHIQESFDLEFDTGDKIMRFANPAKFDKGHIKGCAPRDFEI